VPLPLVKLFEALLQAGILGTVDDGGVVFPVLFPIQHLLEVVASMDAILVFSQEVYVPIVVHLLIEELVSILILLDVPLKLLQEVIVTV
jgi:hypothetical protein